MATANTTPSNKTDDETSFEAISSQYGVLSLVGVQL